MSNQNIECVNLAAFASKNLTNYYMSKTKGNAGFPSTTGKPSGGGRDNNPPKPKR